MAVACPEKLGVGGGGGGGDKVISLHVITRYLKIPIYTFFHKIFWGEDEVPMGVTAMLPAVSCDVAFQRNIFFNCKSPLKMFCVKNKSWN